VLGLIIPLVIIGVWEYFAITLDNPALLPRVENVVERLLHPFADVLNTGSFVRHIIVSASRVILGFLCAVIIGIPLGLLVGRYLLFHRLLSPIIELLRPLCPIAWIPFAMAIFKTYTIANVFGVRYTSTIFGHIQLGMLFVIFYGGFFPIFLNTVHGVKAVKTIFLESALLLGARRSQLFRKVILPSSLPSILTGLRVGLGISWMVIIAAEMLPGSDAGIGYLIMFSYELAEMDILIASMIIIGVVGAVLSYGVKLIADRTSFWQAKER
jgi:NitT/TauT family transport system permease protein